MTPLGDSILDDFVANLRRLMTVEAVVVFGSRGRGEERPWSDYDLVVVSDDFEGVNPIRRRERVAEAWPVMKAADFFALTTTELLEMRRPIIWDMLQDGRPVFDTGVWRRAARRFEALKAAGEIVPIPGGWRVTEGPSDRKEPSDQS
jgi:hypothetical protein